MRFILLFVFLFVPFTKLLAQEQRSKQTPPEVKYDCQPIDEVSASDYNLQVVPIKKGDTIEIQPVENLDLSIYHGKIVVLAISSPSCPLCLRDIVHYSSFSKQWPNNSVIMVNLSFGGPSVNDKPPENRLSRTPQEMLEYVTTSYNKNPYGEVDLTNVDFYHIADTRIAERAFVTTLFPGFMGTPYGVVVDREGKVRFRGHFTLGANSYDGYYGFVDSLVNRSCQIPSSF